MATNIRDNRVVEPLHVAAYDGINRSEPLFIAILSAMVFVLSAPVSIFIGGDVVIVAGILFGIVTITVGFLLAYRLSLANAAIEEDISRPLWPLQSVVVFHERTVTDEALWEAAGLAIDLDAREQEHARLTGALVHTREQEVALERYEADRRETGARILALVTN